MDPAVSRLALCVAFTALVLQFLLSGYHKLAHTRTCKDAQLVERFFGKSCPFNMSILLLAGVWEVMASLAVLWTTYSDTRRDIRRVALLSLLVFTVLATLMFKTSPLKYYGLISNVSVAGGLAIAAAF